MTPFEIAIDNKLNESLRGFDWLEDGWAGSLNDTCQHRLIKGVDWMLFFPNSMRQDERNEEYNTFQIYSEETHEIELENATFDDVIEYVKDNAKNFGWEKQEENDA